MLRRLFLAALLWSGAAVAQTTPASDVPTQLQGQWKVTFASGGTAEVVLEPRRALLGSGIGYIEGRFVTTGAMDLKVWLTPGALSPPVPDSAWQVAIRKAAGFPGLLQTRINLTYDAAKDQMTGTYFSPEIKYDKQTGEYKSTEVTSLGITLSRAAKGRGMAGLP